MDSHFLAFDLGAESGRAILGTLRSGMLDISEVYRFPNDPVLQRRVAALGYSSPVAGNEKGPGRPCRSESLTASASIPGALTTP